MLVAASTECFPSLSLSQAVDTIVDLEYTSLEIDIHEDGNHLRPSIVAANMEAAITACRNTHRASVVSYSVRINAEGEAVAADAAVFWLIPEFLCLMTDGS